tara:strand:- start:867 stop:1268 length:402 start_codon:yes stop_codon:yes gene_type:complete
MDLIKELKEQHIEIRRYFESLKKLLKEKDESFISEIKELKEIIIEHLGLEDRILYPALSENKNIEAKEAGEKFSTEMLSISKKIISFFDNCEKEMINKKNFNEEFEDIIKKVSIRVDTEEEILFPLYEKYVKK